MHAILSPADAIENANLKAEMDARIARWPKDYLFEVYASHGGHARYTLSNRIIAQRMQFAPARALAAKLQARYDAKHPHARCWTKRYYSARRSYLIP